MAIIKTKFNRGVEGTTNIVDAGTEGTRVATGTTAQQGSTAGQWRFNSTTGFFEGRGASTFSSLEPVPTIASVDDGEVDSGAGGNQTIVITGTNFTSGGTASFVGSSASFNASSTTIDSPTQITAVAPKSSFLNAQEPYKVKFTTASGITGTSANGLINVDNSPTWSTSAGSLGSITENTTGNHFTVSASDPEGDTVAYSLQSGSLAGLSLNSSTGVISGDPTNVSSDTTNNFTLRATAGGKTSDRAFSYITTNVLEYEMLVVAGGGSGGYTTQGWAGGGGGSGGIAYHNGSTQLATSTNYTVTVGNGGSTATGHSEGGSNVSDSGQNSQITGSGLTTILAYGGGGGAGYDGAYTIGASGGSGGGSEGGAHGQSQGAAATQGTGGTTYYGNRGGIGSNGPSAYAAGGGGGSHEPGGTDGQSTGGDGTAAFSTWLVATSTGVDSGGTRYIAGGGSGGKGTQSSTAAGGLGGGGVGGNNSGSSGTAGTVNTGSGGGGRGRYNAGSGTGGAGGSGVVIIRYAGTQIGGSSGGTIVTTGGYTYHTFTSSGTFRTST